MRVSQDVPENLARVYRQRFQGQEAYRTRVWRELCKYLERTVIRPGSSVLEIGSGYGEFINNINGRRKVALDLNPDSQSHLNADVLFINQDVATEWPLPDGEMDVVFTSNFLEHLPSKCVVEQAIRSAYRCLRSGGLFVAMGPNIKFAPGQYWDFWDHQLPITERSLAEVLRLCGFTQIHTIPRFLPFSMSNDRRYPLVLVRLYLNLPLLWRVLGKQFLVTAMR